MKNRPKLWHYLPYRVIEWLANNVELDYDSYEGSNAEEVEKILCSYYNDFPSSRNYQAMQERYESITDIELTTHIQQIIDSLKSQSNDLQETLDGMI